MKTRYGLLYSSMLLIGTSYSASIYASGIFIDTQTASGVGYAFAGSTALAENASAIVYNPATMTALKQGHHISGSATYVVAETEFQSHNTSPISPIVPLGNTTETLEREAAIPSVQYVFNSADRYAFGFGISPMYGNQGEWSNQFIGRYQGLKTEVTGINANASLGYQFSPNLSVGIGLNYLDFDATLSRNVAPIINTNSTPPMYLTDAQGELAGDGDGWAVNLGLLWRPTNQLDVGFNYRSETELELDGQLKVSSPQGIRSIPAEMEISMPQSASLGFAYKLSPTWTALGELSWYDWSVLPSFSAVSKQDGSMVYEETLNFEDGLKASLGAMYQLNPTTQLRFGTAYDRSVVTSSSDRTVRFPDADRIWLSIGAGFQLNDQLSLDLGYAHVFSNQATIESPTIISGNPTMQNLQGTFDTDADMFSIQMNYHF
ncbi:long-chain fatty acid transport protein [Acinetobacter marinus]|uniref:Long-chain fatty acid transport protein n=1 Tax=Acinetobacter marinus TaxID=281375 RepID=A0A1G6GJE7_9GAMM|nr:outer membrane protein transport protein [Acinetobacter marinus]SDB82118.1 long-chain fatty acid transport protein [Acinetobacter marinus]